MEAAIELKRVTRDFSTSLAGARVRALDDISLTVPSGCICGLLGPNGGGKSTLLRLVLGLLEPTAGSVRVLGRPAGSTEALRRIGYLPDTPRFPRYLSGRELVRYHGRLAGLPNRGLGARVDDVLGRVGMAEAADRRIGTYSKGMVQRIGLAQALVHDPQLVILDEPSAGLDPLAADELAALLALLRSEGRTVLITTHQLGAVEELCDRVAILQRGRLVAEGAVHALAGEDSASQTLLVGPLSAGERADLQSWLTLRGYRSSASLPPGRLARAYTRSLADTRIGGASP